MTARSYLLFVILFFSNTTIINLDACATPYCCTMRDGPTPPVPPIPPVPGVGAMSFMNSLANHNGPSVGNIGGNLSTTGITEYLTKGCCGGTDCFNLTSPGVYFLGEPLILPPDNSYGACTAGITISASDVTLDLNGFSITYGDPTPAPTVFHGVKIAAGVKNITIKNGAIRGFIYGSGVYAASTAAATGSIQQVVLSDLMVQNNAAGVTFDGTLNALKLINITTSTISNNLSYGVKYSYVNTGKFSSVTASENTNSAGNAQGVWLTNCNNIDLFAVDTERNAATGGTGYGVLVDACNKISFYYSNANYNTGTTTSYGIALTSSNTCKLDSNNANENTIGYYDNLAITTSLFVNNSAAKNGSPSTEDTALVANYNIIAASGGVTVSSAANLTALNAFIRNQSIHSPQALSNTGKFWNFSWMN